jgi:rhamnosyltransferase subunit B
MLTSSMRVIIFSMGSAGDVHPFIGLGRALKTRGHKVHLATSPAFKNAVTAADLDFHPLGTVEDFQKVQDNPDLWHPQRSLPLIVKHVASPSYPLILDLCRELHEPGNTVIISSSLGFGASIPSEVLDCPWVTVHLAPSLFMSSEEPPKLPGLPFGSGAPRFLKKIQCWMANKIVDHEILPELNRFRTEHGLAPMKDMLMDGWHAPERVIALFPEWFAKPQSDWPKQTCLTGFPLFDEGHSAALPEELDEFLKTGDAPVIATPGSAMAHGRRFFSEVVDALQRCGKRGILLTRFKENIPAQLPPGIRHFSYAPFSQVLPHAAALIYHGGIGTCAQAMQAGIPHLLQPMAHDQFDTLARVRSLGIGDGLKPSRFTGPRIADMLDRLLGDEGLKQRADEIAARFSPQSWLERSCELIEEVRRKRVS